MLLPSRVCCCCILSSLLCHHNTAKSSSSWPPSLCWYPTTKHTITQVFCSQLTTKEEEEEGAKISQASHPLTCSEEKKRICPLLCWWSEPAPQTWVTLFRSRFSVTSFGCWVLCCWVLLLVLSWCNNSVVTPEWWWRYQVLLQCTRVCANPPVITIQSTWYWTNATVHLTSAPVVAPICLG